MRLLAKARRKISFARCLATAPNGTLQRQNELEKIIRNSIKATGPLSIASYMSLCLSHPTRGYYTTQHIFGSRGDFITSPEISQVFGELLAIWFLSCWQAAGSPSPLRLIELGPGLGTLLSDLLRTFSQFPRCLAALKDLCLVEMSPKLQETQRRVLENSKFVDLNAQWSTHVEGISPEYVGYTMIVAHEYFDALPIHIFEKRETGFHEVKVDRVSPLPVKGTIDPSGPSCGLQYALTPTPTVLPLHTLFNVSPELLASLPDKSRLEFSPLSLTTAGHIAQLMDESQKGGSALIVDYSTEGVKGDTFRAFKNHIQVHPLHEPGAADLTASVNFSLLKQTVMRAQPNVRCHGPLSQSSFLTRMGLHMRTQRLLSAAQDEEQRKRFLNGAMRLVDEGPGGMGEQYAILGLTHEINATTNEVWPFMAQTLI